MCLFEADLGWKPRIPIELIPSAKPKVAAVDQLQNFSKCTSMMQFIITHFQKQNKLQKPPVTLNAFFSLVTRSNLGLSFEETTIRRVYTSSAPDEIEGTPFRTNSQNAIGWENTIKFDFPTYLKTHKVVHVSWTLHVVHRSRELKHDIWAQLKLPHDIIVAVDELYEVEKIRAHRGGERSYQWLTLLKEMELHGVEWQLTRDFVDADGTLTDAFWLYIQTPASVPACSKLFREQRWISALDSELRFYILDLINHFACLQKVLMFSNPTNLTIVALTWHWPVVMLNPSSSSLQHFFWFLEATMKLLLQEWVGDSASVQQLTC